MRKQDTVIVTGEDLAPAALAMLDNYEVVFAGSKPSEDDLFTLCQQYNPVGIVVRYGKINARIMDAAPALRVISKHGSGIDVIDQDAAGERNISVQSAPGANAAAVAEHTWALILACTKSLLPLDRRMREGHWDKSTHKSLELEGRTLGLVGLGAIGGRVADIGRVFGMQVIAYDPWAKTLPAGCEQVDDLATLYARADIVSLHCPLTAQNSKMINEQALAQFKPGAVLINTARGGLIDDDALIRALKSGKLRGAALDSFTVEPLSAPHIWQSVENVIITPHIGGVSDNSYVKMGTASVTNLLKVLAQKEATV